MMKKMDYQNVRGTQDYLPEQELVRRKIRRTLEDTFIRYGCQPLETPILNEQRLMASKYAGGAEILKEMYCLSDRGKRDLTLRYDLTIPFAKVVGMNPQLSMPFKRYEIGKVFRDGPIKTGRLREFTQCDVDVVGVTSQAAEAELMMMAIEALTQLKVDVVIQYNNRKLLYGLLQAFEVPEPFMNQVVLILDKMEKIDRNTLVAELRNVQLTAPTIAQIEQFLNEKPRISELIKYENVNRWIDEGLMEIKELIDYLEALGIEQKCVFNPFLARGLDIYTGTIYELFLANGAIKSSIGSGGRYDRAIGGLIGNNESYPTVGISFGLDVIYKAFELSGLVQQQSDLDIYIIPIGTEKRALQLATSLRQQGQRVLVEMNQRKVGKAMDKANREQIPAVIVLGEREVENNRYTLKNMVSGEVTEYEYTFNA